jgi:hypothetical protein
MLSLFAKFIDRVTGRKIAKLRADQVKTKQGFAAAERELEQLNSRRRGMQMRT